MRLPEQRVELAVSKDAERTNLRAVRFDKERSQLSATDGHIAAIVPIDQGTWEEDDITSNIDPDAIALARKEMRKHLASVDDVEKPNLRKIGAVVTATADGVTLASGKFFPNPDPQIQFPDLEALPFERDPRRYDLVISLNAALLHQVAQAISTNEVIRIFIKRGSHGYFVEPVPHEDREHDRGEGKRLPHGFIMGVHDAEMDVIFGRKVVENAAGEQRENPSV